MRTIVLCKVNLFSFVSFLLLFIYSCSTEPEPINYGHDECEFCRMLITDNKYGSELVTDKGKIYKFDSIECLVEFSIVKNIIGDMNNKFLVSDFGNPGTLLNCTESYYVKTDKYRSPMGLNVSAFSEKDKMENFISQNGGETLSWVDVIELIKQRSMY